jgi:hypothetical protein
MDSKPDLKHLEEVDTETVEAIKADDLILADSNVKVLGTVLLTTHATVFIPTPTADPRGTQIRTDANWAEDANRRVAQTL